MLRLFAPAVALASLAASAIAATTAPSLECRLRLPAQVRSGEPVSLRFELNNHGKSRLRVLSWNTPLEGWFGRYLRITLDGREIPYQGPQLKRGTPAADDYVVVGAGKQARATVDLTQVYEMAVPGNYRVAFDGVLHDVTAGAPSAKRRTPYTLFCPEVGVEVVKAP